MKLYDAAWAPSPRRVRIFLAETGIDVERVTVDLRAGEQLGEAYLAVNPRGTVPALVLDDGEVLTESAAICHYLEALHRAPPLFGADPPEIGRIEEWTRRIESEGYAAAVYAWRNTRPGFAGRALPGQWPEVEQLPGLAERARVMWARFVAALEHQLGSRVWIVGERYSFADVSALVTIDFARAAGLAVPDGCAGLARWHAAATARPSAAA